MDIDKYQELAQLTDVYADKKEEENLMIPLLGLAGETGTLLSEFKKHIRDGESYAGFSERAKEELGDVLWYLANLASRLDVPLSEVAKKNLEKTEERWALSDSAEYGHVLFDDDYPSHEQLPRSLEIEVAVNSDSGKVEMFVLPNKSKVGDGLTDNSYEDDGYRYHDVLHFANMAVLGWSPIMRKFLGLKRKSNQRVDEVEDGGRAAILEELIVAYVYNNASERNLYEGLEHVDTELLSTIKRLVAGFEVSRCRTQDWERAILQGYEAFRHLVKNSQGTFKLDLLNRTLMILK